MLDMIHVTFTTFQLFTSTIESIFVAKKQFCHILHDTLSHTRVERVDGFLEIAEASYVYLSCKDKWSLHVQRRSVHAKNLVRVRDVYVRLGVSGVKSPELCGQFFAILGMSLDQHTSLSLTSKNASTIVCISVVAYDICCICCWISRCVIYFISISQLEQRAILFATV